jgi:SAM-dependent methyltransferase
VTPFKLRAAKLLKRVGVLPFGMDIYQGVRQLPAWARTDARTRSLAPDGLPLPGPVMRVSSTGTADSGWFVSSGKLAAESVSECLRAVGVDLEAGTKILDFGCGCGRVVRQWKSLRNTSVFGTDQNRRAVAWCTRHLTFASFSVNDMAPPLPFEGGQFDVVYALSVFTHLPESLQYAWIADLCRVLKPRGHLLIKTHGEAYLGALSPEEQEELRRHGFVVQNEELAGTNLCGAFHSREYVERTLARDFDVALFQAEGAKGNPRQDVFVLRKRVGEG